MEVIFKSGTIDWQLSVINVEENRINCDLVIFEGEALKIVVWEVGGCGKFIGDACVLGLM